MMNKIFQWCLLKKNLKKFEGSHSKLSLGWEDETHVIIKALIKGPW